MKAHNNIRVWLYVIPFPLQGSQCVHDKLRFRYPSALEVKRDTYFSNCTMPVLIFSNGVQNYAGKLCVC